MTDRSTALVVGASRGLGLALVQEWLERGWRVIATARGRSDPLEALANRFPGSLAIETVDINDAGTVRALRDRLSGRRVDVLFINAGIARAIDGSPAGVSEADFLDMMLTNAFSPVRAVELLHDLVPPRGTVAIMSSELGSIANATGGWQLYASSKAALNMMKGYAAKHPDDGHALLLVAPGWVRTEMGGSDAALSIEDSIPFVVDMIDANRGRPGLRYVDRFKQSLPW